MKESISGFSRRDFIKSSSVGTAAILTAGTGAYAAGSDTIRVGLIGCGSRGTGAGIIDCAESSKGIQLVAMGDLFQDHLEAAPALIKENLEKRQLSFKDIYKVTPERMFAGMEAYQKVLEAGVDMVILATPPCFRPEHFKAAVEAGKHVFVEKPIAVDPVGVRSVLQTSELASKKGLTVVSGTQMRRFKPLRQATQRIQDGAIGDFVAGQVFRTGDAMRGWKSNQKFQKAEWTDFEYQMRRWLFWTWSAGDFIVEMHVHNLDIMNWIMGSHPVSCIAMGGRQVRTEPEYGNIYDHFSAEYIYPNEVRVQYMGTQIDGFTYRNDQRVQGLKGSAYLDFSTASIQGSQEWEYADTHMNPSVLQYKEMIDSIRNGEALNEGRQVAESTLTAIMGRMAAYTGRSLNWDWVMNRSILDLVQPESPSGEVRHTDIGMPGVTRLI